MTSRRAAERVLHVELVRLVALGQDALRGETQLKCVQRRRRAASIASHRLPAAPSRPTRACLLSAAHHYRLFEAMRTS
jgi:hypothetical protein